MTTTIRNYRVTDIKGLTVPEVKALETAGIKNTRALLARVGVEGEAAVAKAVGMNRSHFHEARNRADLMRLAPPGLADVFEQVGVNSVKELALRRADALAKTVAAFHAQHPEVRFRLPKPTDVQALIEKAKALGTTTPPAPATPTVTNAADARPYAEAAMNRYLDDVLFSNDPAGASYRDAVSWSERSPAEQDQIRKAMHDGVSKFFTDAEVYDKNGVLTLAGRVDGLYTEVDVEKATAKVSRVYVEID